MAASDSLGRQFSGYHGTTDEAARHIEASGFEPGSDAHRGAIWITPRQDLAESYARSRAKREGKGPAVFAVEGEGKPADYLNFKMARESGADFSDLGAEIAIHNPRAIKKIRRVL